MAMPIPNIYNLIKYDILLDVYVKPQTTQYINNGADMRPIHPNQTGVCGINCSIWSTSINKSDSNFKVVVVTTILLNVIYNTSISYFNYEICTLLFMLIISLT